MRTCRMQEAVWCVWLVGLEGESHGRRGGEPGSSAVVHNQVGPVAEQGTSEGRTTSVARRAARGLGRSIAG